MFKNFICSKHSRSYFLSYKSMASFVNICVHSENAVDFLLTARHWFRLFIAPENKIKPTRLETIFLMVILSDDEFECSRTQLHFWVCWINKNYWRSLILKKSVRNSVVFKLNSLLLSHTYSFVYFMVTMEDDNQNKLNYFYHTDTRLKMPEYCK